MIVAGPILMHPLGFDVAQVGRQPNGLVPAHSVAKTCNFGARKLLTEAVVNHELDIRRAEPPARLLNKQGMNFPTQSNLLVALALDALLLSLFRFFYLA